MFVKRLLRASVVAGMGVIFLCLAMGGSASALEAYSLSNQINRLSYPLGVAVASDGTVYVADQSNSRVVQFDPFNFSYPMNQCTFESPAYYPLSLAVDPDGEVYYVTRYGPTGDIIRFGSPDSCSFTEVGTPAKVYYGGVAVAPDGSIFVADSTDDSTGDEILKFGPDGTFIKSWGTQGTGVPDSAACSLCDQAADPAACREVACDAHFKSPKGLAILGGSVLLVADSGNNRIQAFDLNGDFIGAIGSLGTGQWQFKSPDGIAVGADGNVYISDTGNNRVEKVLMADGSISQIDDGSLSGPEGLSVDSGGNVYVADSDNDRVAIFTPNVVVFDNGAASKTITGNQPFSVSLAINPDSYWNGAVSELYLWVEYQGIKAYWAGLPLDLVGFSSPSQMKPLISGVPVPNVPAFTLTVLNDSSVLPAGTYTLHLCLDRDVNGTFDPSASVCGSINVVRQ